jgi:transcriptional regulator with XRE-family HTH domain
LADNLFGGEPLICSLPIPANADMSDVVMTVVVGGLLFDTNNLLPLHLSSCHASNPCIACADTVLRTLFAMSNQEYLSFANRIRRYNELEEKTREGGEMASIGDRIREIREARKMTQDLLAEKSAISKGFLSDVENNKRNVSSENLLRIANVLGASLDYLLRGATTEFVSREPVTIPPELSETAEKLNLTYAQTVELLEAHRSVLARRSAKQAKHFTVEDWENLHRAIRQVFG